MEREAKNAGITGSTLKIIALVTMIIDHIGVVIICPLCDASLWLDDGLVNSYEIMRTIGRMAFPIYCFLLVEGFKYTHDRTRYAIRLFIFALISEVPFDLAINGSVWQMSYNNVFFTLLLGFIAIVLLDKILKFKTNAARAKRDSVKSMAENGNDADNASEELAVESPQIRLVKGLIMAAVSLAIMFVAEEIVRCDYGASGVAAIVLLYLLKDNKMLAFTAAVIALAFLSNPIEIFAILMLIPLHFYNGKRGASLKYLFYAAYPVHLLILAGLAKFVFYPS